MNKVTYGETTNTRFQDYCNLKCIDIVYFKKILVCFVRGIQFFIPHSISFKLRGKTNFQSVVEISHVRTKVEYVELVIKQNCAGLCFCFLSFKKIIER